MKIDVLYEDNHLIAVKKPAGVLTQGDKTGDISLYDMVKDYIRIKKGKGSLLNGNAKPRTEPAGSGSGVFLGLLHRLDRPVSGIILFAKTSKGASRLSEQFRNHSVVKIYHAIVFGKPAKNRGTLVNYLNKDERNKKAAVSDNNDGQEAVLDYDVVVSNEKFSLLKIQLETGRFHQIRAQLAHAGLPILGDLKYGPPSSRGDFGEASAPFFPVGSIALAATYLSFETATTKEQKEISIPLPKEWEEYIK